MNPMQISPQGAMSGHDAMESPMPGGAEEMGGGNAYGDLTAETVFNPDDRVKHVLWNRISVLDDAELEMVDAMVTPQNVAMWLKLFPELSELLAQASAMDAVMGMSQEEIMAQHGGMPQAMPGPLPMMQQQPPPRNGIAGQRFGG